jgi:hypothetical protein
MAVGQPERRHVHRPAGQSPEEQQRQVECDDRVPGESRQRPHPECGRQERLHQGQGRAEGIEGGTLEQEPGLSQEIVEHGQHHDDVVAVQTLHPAKRPRERRVEGDQPQEEARDQEVGTEPQAPLSLGRWRVSHGARLPDPHASSVTIVVRRRGGQARGRWRAPGRRGAYAGNLRRAMMQGPTRRRGSRGDPPVLPRLECPLPARAAGD